MSSLAIDVRDLRKTYVQGLLFKKRFEALKGISFSVSRGEIFGLLGPNGAGKTTFIKILLGIIRKSAGDASMLDHPAGSRQARQKVGYVPENLAVPRHLNSRSALEYYGNLSNVPTSVIRSKQDELLELVGLAARAKDSVKTYSKGMRQRLGLAQALLHEPEMLVLDEPTDGLDPLARSQVRTLLADLKRKGVTIFLNSHILQEVDLICDRVAVLNHGELQVTGSKSEIVDFLQNRGGGGSSIVEIEIDLEGDEAAVRQAMNGCDVQTIDARGGEVRVAARLENQSQVDQRIDALRAAGVSIVGLSRRKMTLEDAFIQLVSDNGK